MLSVTHNLGQKRGGKKVSCGLMMFNGTQYHGFNVVYIMWFNCGLIKQMEASKVITVPKMDGLQSKFHLKTDDDLGVALF